MAPTSSALFVPTGTMDTFIVPSHVPGTLKVSLRGGRGRRLSWASSLVTGGDGGRISGYLNLPAGAPVTVVVGAGAQSTEGGSDGVEALGWEGLGPFLGGQGGNGHSGFAGDAAGGGGSSDLRYGGTSVANRILVGGGGGGGGGGGIGLNSRGGAGGVGLAAGGSGAGVPRAGQGGTLVAGGPGGETLNNACNSGCITGEFYNGTPGGFGAGGIGGYSFATIYDPPGSRGGSGGGGGYYGGGGGGHQWLSGGRQEGAGGGGSSWADVGVVSDVTGVVGDPGGWTGSYVLFEWEAAPRGPRLGLYR